MNRLQKRYVPKITTKPLKSMTRPQSPYRRGAVRVPIRSVDRSSSIGPDDIDMNMKKEYYNVEKVKENEENMQNNEEQKEAPPSMPNMDSSLFSTILFKESESSSLCYCLDESGENVVEPGGEVASTTAENKSLQAKPSIKDFGQHYEMNQSVQTEHFGFNPLLLEEIDRLRELKSILCYAKPTIEHATQYVADTDTAEVNCVGTSFHQPLNYGNTEVINVLESLQSSEKSLPQSEDIQICISRKPRVKVIAEKFSKYKKNALEVRKMKEKVVCLEYDVFDEENINTPREKMRAYFSIKPKFKDADEDWESPRRSQTSSTNEISKDTQKHIEIIDSRISDNQSYLDDLRKVLQRKLYTNIRKKKSSLDLECLYDFAKKSKPILDNILSDAFLSEKQLDEVKEVILQARNSSVHGISRRKVKCNQDISNLSSSVISKTIMAELYRETGK